MPLPADYLIVSPGLYISQAALDQIEDAGPVSKWHDAKLIPEAMQQVIAVHTGLKRPGFDRAKCHVTRPKIRHDSGGEQISRQSERLFVIYTNQQQYGDVVFDWEWRPGDEHSGKLHDQTFGEDCNGQQETA